MPRKTLFKLIFVFLYVPYLLSQPSVRWEIETDYPYSHVNELSDSSLVFLGRENDLNQVLSKYDKNGNHIFTKNLENLRTYYPKFDL